MKRILKKDIAEKKKEAIIEIDKTYGTGYAKEHPMLIEAYVLNWKTEQIEKNIVDALYDLETQISEAKEEINRERENLNIAVSNLCDQMDRYNNNR